MIHGLGQIPQAWTPKFSGLLPRENRARAPTWVTRVSSLIIPTSRTLQTQKLRILALEIPSLGGIASRIGIIPGVGALEAASGILAAKRRGKNTLGNGVDSTSLFRRLQADVI